MKYSIMLSLSFQGAAKYKFRKDCILMMDTECKLLKEVFAARAEIALSSLKSHAHYCEISQRQERTGKIVDELLHRFEKEERISIRRHYEGETEKTGIEFDAVYAQGLKDSIKILKLLGILSTDISL